MGDLVAVFQAGGRARPVRHARPRSSPAPASDFVARFVGADRGLKRLSLVRVSDLALVGRRPPGGPADAVVEGDGR